MALSFIRSANDIIQLREYLESLNSDISIIAKIEKPEALKQLNQIIEKINNQEGVFSVTRYEQ